MARPPSRSGPPAAQAGGFLIAVGVLGGAVLGVIFGQPTIGVLGGFGISTAIALALWVIDRRQAP